MERQTSLDIDRAAAALYRDLRDYDFLANWTDDALMRQATWAASIGLTRITFMRLMVFAAGKWMTDHVLGLQDLVAALNGAPMDVMGRDDYPF